MHWIEWETEKPGLENNQETTAKSCPRNCFVGTQLVTTVTRTLLDMDPAGGTATGPWPPNENILCFSYHQTKTTARSAPLQPISSLPSCSLETERVYVF